jgi:uncharacterized protein (TIGR03503 family)
LHASRILLSAVLLCAAASVAAGGTPPDVRVLIDVSGSMRRNDPSNLRIPALTLLTELLPTGTTAGVWTFDEQPTALLGPGTVDTAWKGHARSAARRIDSRGLFTDIESALAAATADWTAGNKGAAMRRVILLTDGMVDVGKDPAANAASRARLIDAGLARLQALGAHVDTIALSSNADRQLLQTLATRTDGWFEQAADAAALQRVFLHLFEQAAPPDALPLNGNRFTVDTSVKELTLLIFHPTDAPPLVLRAPDGRSVTQQNAGPDMAWRHEDGYDLVTLTAPQAGTWSFNGDADPDNRALIVTDLALELATLPTNLVPGEPARISARLLEQGRPLTRDDFLNLVKADVATSSASGEGAVDTLTLDPAEHSFDGELSGAKQPGEYELVVRVDGGTFQREQRRRLKVMGDPVTFSAEAARSDSDEQVIHLTITADPVAIEPATFSGLLELTAPGRSPQVLELPPLSENEITVELAAPTRGEYRLQPWVYAQTTATRLVKVKPPPIALDLADGASVAPDAPPAPAPLPVAPAFSWATTAVVVGVGNVGLGSLLGALWVALRRRPTPTKGVSL